MIMILILLCLITLNISFIVVSIIYYKKIKHLSYRQEIIWDYILSRAKLSFLQKGMGTED